MSYDQPYVGNTNDAPQQQYGQPPPYGQPPSYGQQPGYGQPVNPPPQQVIIVNQPADFVGAQNFCRVCNKATPSRI